MEGKLSPNHVTDTCSQGLGGQSLYYLRQRTYWCTKTQFQLGLIKIARLGSKPHMTAIPQTLHTTYVALHQSISVTACLVPSSRVNHHFDLFFALFWLWQRTSCLIMLPHLGQQSLTVSWHFQQFSQLKMLFCGTQFILTINQKGMVFKTGCNK